MKNEMRPTTSGNSSSAAPGPSRAPRRARRSRSASPYASSCTGVAPASCRWYGQTLIGFHVGEVLHRVRDEVDGEPLRLPRAGRCTCPRDRYSFTMSFCVVPASIDVRRRRARRRARCTARAATSPVALIVIDVFISSSGMPVEERAHLAEVRDRHADLADLAARERRRRGRSRSGSAGRTRPTARSGPSRGCVRYSSFDARADEWPEYVRMTQGRSRSVTAPFSPRRRRRSRDPGRPGTLAGYFLR